MKNIKILETDVWVGNWCVDVVKDWNGRIGFLGQDGVGNAWGDEGEVVEIDDTLWGIYTKEEITGDVLGINMESFTEEEIEEEIEKAKEILKYYE